MTPADFSWLEDHDLTSITTTKVGCFVALAVGAASGGVFYLWLHYSGADVRLAGILDGMALLFIFPLAFAYLHNRVILFDTANRVMTVKSVWFQGPEGKSKKYPFHEIQSVDFYEGEGASVVLVMTSGARFGVRSHTLDPRVYCDALRRGLRK